MIKFIFQNACDGIPTLYFNVFFIFLCNFQGSNGGDKEIRTLDPLLARQVLSQLSYTPILKEHYSSFA